MRIRRLPGAVADVDAIWLHIAQDNPSAATRVTRRIAAATDRLLDFPQSGTARTELHPDARSIVAAPYVIFYRIGTQTVDIVRVLHGARDLSVVSDDF